VLGSTLAHTTDNGGQMTELVARACWAKSAGTSWMSVAQHLDDSAAIAGQLWDEWLSRSIRLRIEASLESPQSARGLVTLMAGLHDVGKISPAFACQLTAHEQVMADRGLHIGAAVRANRHEAPHALVGAFALRTWLRETAGWSQSSAQSLAVIIGGHHGRPPTQLVRPPREDLVGTGAWADARDKMIEAAVDCSGSRNHLAGWNRQPPDEPAQALISAVVILADWLASNVELFPLSENESGSARAEWAWRQLALPGPWTPSLSDAFDPGIWAARFTLPPGATPRPIQTAALDMVRGATAPRLLVVEAGMGEGKTEAALMAAEVMAARSGASGAIVALPTMATSDAMFRRVLDWLDMLPPPDNGSAGWSTYLAHGKAQLNEQFRGLHRADLTGVGIDDPGGTAVAHAWLSGRKKGLLSSFVVGTIDQVLVGALRTKHLALRHLALAGKVVVLDEVHAADEYMSTYLECVLAWLGAYDVPTVLLSATLPPARRAALVTAYRSGTSDSAIETSTVQAVGYPLLTIVDGSAVSSVAPPSSGRESTVALERLADDRLVEYVVDALREGGTAAVICNTVTRAQHFARELREHFGDDVMLLHSRFIAEDRRSRESRTRELLGPPGSGARPHRLVVVGTQVLEQSLDVDFDLMVTDLAPVDLVLQRLGRLHRHSRPADSRPPRLSTPKCLISGVEHWAAAAPQAVRGSRRVYGEAALLRSVTVLRRFLDGQPLHLPEDIAALVTDAYEAYDPVDPDPRWPDALRSAEAVAVSLDAGRRTEAERYLLRRPNGHKTLMEWLDGGADEDSADGQAAVRDGVQGIEVVLLREREGALFLPSWMPSSNTPVSGGADDDLALGVLGCAVRLPTWCTDAAGALTTPSEWSTSRWLSGSLVVPATSTDDGTLHATVGSFELAYTQQEGLTMTRSIRA
jgi:CRISPR-associated helicase Cas3/CRISPR-associated endonuclease Cas3-HD